MLRSAAHIHFREGERGPEEASLRFEEGMAVLERYSIQEAVVTFHLRHPTDLRPASPQVLLQYVAQYDGPVKLTVMPEANLIFSSQGEDGATVTHDIETWKDVRVSPPNLCSLIKGWILSAHYTKALGWSKEEDSEDAPEQTNNFAARVYAKIMAQDWQGWIGHPFRWCSGKDKIEPLKQTLALALERSHLLEIPAAGFDQGKSVSRVMLQPDVIAQFAPQSILNDRPAIAISLDAHHLPELEERIESSFRLAEWLVSEGVQPNQIWGWHAS